MSFTTNRSPLPSRTARYTRDVAPVPSSPVMDQPWPSRDSIAAIRFMKCGEVSAVPTKGRPNRLYGYGFFSFRARYIPLVAAFDTLPELPARLVGLHFCAEVAALRALLRHG